MLSFEDRIIYIYRCLLFDSVENGEFVHIDLNCKEALSLGRSHINSPSRSKRQVDRVSR